MSRFLIEDIEILEASEEVLSTMTKEGTRRWMYPTVSKGRFYDKRMIVGWLLIAFFVSLPLLKINGHPAILLDFVHREFSFFGVVFYPTDTFLLMLLGIGLILTVVLGTALLGRVWCGWGCPQTVYLEFVYRPIERWLEGKEHIRQKRDADPFAFDNLWRKLLKWAIYLVISFLLANVFVSYFVGWERLSAWMQHSPFENWGFFSLMTGTTALVFFDFTYFREQMCLITCPYARMQSVLLDKDSMIVSYDPSRGEPRGHRSKKQLEAEAEGTKGALGDCIDCLACVRTCPTGIDIRKGLQMECVACTQCIDACDSIMTKIHKPTGLIRYTSENTLSGKSSRIIRPRVMVYIVLLVGIWSFLGISLFNRQDYDLSVIRHPSAPFIKLSETEVMNRVRVRARNQTAKTANLKLTVAEPQNIRVQMIGAPTIALKPAEMQHVEAFIIVPTAYFKNKTDIPATIRFTSADGKTTDIPFSLIGPNQ